MLASDEDLELPCDLDLGDEPDDSDLRGWCIGFMEGVFLREEVWFEQAEEEVSELLLPIMVGSGLFDEQPEFDEIARDRHLVDDMVAQIPDLLTNLFLLCQAPEEKPALPAAHAFQGAPRWRSGKFARALASGCAIASRPWVS